MRLTLPPLPACLPVQTIVMQREPPLHILTEPRAAPAVPGGGSTAEQSAPQRRVPPSPEFLDFLRLCLKVRRIYWFFPLLLDSHHFTHVPLWLPAARACTPAFRRRLTLPPLHRKPLCAARERGRRLIRADRRHRCFCCQCGCRAIQLVRSRGGRAADRGQPGRGAACL